MADVEERMAWRFVFTIMLVVVLMNMLSDALMQVLPGHSWLIQAMVLLAMIAAGVLIMFRLRRMARTDLPVPWSVCAQIALAAALASAPVMYILRRLGITVELVVAGIGLVTATTWAVLRERRARTGQGG